VIGSGAIARAHLHYVRGLRQWHDIRLFSPSLARQSAAQRQQLTDLDNRVQLADSLEQALIDADVIMLCTSSAGPVIDPGQLSKPALITSISTNAVRAHEVPRPACKTWMCTAITG
jgi:L-arginine dehydrogenase